MLAMPFSDAKKHKLFLITMFKLYICTIKRSNSENVKVDAVLGVKQKVYKYCQLSTEYMNQTICTVLCCNKSNLVIPIYE